MVLTLPPLGFVAGRGAGVRGLYPFTAGSLGSILPRIEPDGAFPQSQAPILR